MKEELKCVSINTQLYALFLNIIQSNITIHTFDRKSFTKQHTNQHTYTYV